MNDMIAMTDDNWASAKLAVGLFSNGDVNDGTPYFGVNAEVIGGKLIVGNNLIIENMNDEGVMQFKVDSSGAWLNNSTFVLQKDNGGKILLDPRYGIVGGTNDLYDTEGTTVFPAFINEKGEIELDGEGFPTNSNFFLDLRDGSAYFRGKVYATDGVFNGTVYAKDGKFTGLLDAAKIKGDLLAETGEGNQGWLRGCGISVGGNYRYGEGNFYVDPDGNVTMKGSINLSNGSISWGGNAPVKYQFSASGTGGWHDEMQTSDKYRRDSLDGGKTWGSAYQFKGTDGRNGSDANVPDYIQNTYIDASQVSSPLIQGDKIEALCGQGSDNGFVLSREYNGDIITLMIMVSVSTLILAMTG